MEIKIKIEADDIKRRLYDFKEKVVSNKKNIGLVLVAIYCIGSFLFITVNTVADYAEIITVEGYCKNMSGYNITVNAATYHMWNRVDSCREYFEGYDVRIVMHYSNTFDAYVWKSMECI